MFYILDSVNGGSTAVEGSVLYIDSTGLVVIDHASGYSNAVINLAVGQMVVRDEEEQDEDEECPGCAECDPDYEDDEDEEDNDDEDDEDDDDREDDE